MDSAQGNSPAASVPDNSAVYFDGLSSRRRAVSLAFMDALEISGDEASLSRGPIPISAAPTASRAPFA